MKRHIRNRVIGLAAGTVAFGAISACGGGGSGGGLDVADGGIRGTGSSVGPVSGFGSVFVNGVEFTTDRTVIGDDGISQESRLVVGMILRVDGEWRDTELGDADTVEYDDTLRGVMQVVTPWDPVSKTAAVRILGQTVRIDSQTVVKGSLVENLADGDFVRMSGWRLPSGEFRASYIGLRTDQNRDVFDDQDKVELEGVIDELSDSQLRIGSQLVDYSGATPDGLDLSNLAVDLAVEVEGYIVDSVLMADEIRPDDSRRYSPGTEDDIEFVGPVSDTYDPATGIVTVNGIPVQVTSETEFDGLAGPSDLVQGLLIQVEGDFESDGSVTAEEIELREADSEIQGGPAQEIDLTLRQFRVGGVLVQVTPLTIITDDDDSRLSLSDLTLPRELEIEGVERLGDDGRVFLEALKIEREDDFPDDEFELVGRLRAISPSTITVLGVTLDVRDTEFDDVNFDDLVREFGRGARPRLEVDYGERDGLYFAEEVELDDD